MTGDVSTSLDDWFDHRRGDAADLPDRKGVPQLALDERNERCILVGRRRAMDPTRNGEVSMAVKAIIGATGHGTFGIVWKDFPEMEARGGYSGPFEDWAEAADRAEVIAEYYAEKVIVQHVDSLADVEGV